MLGVLAILALVAGTVGFMAGWITKAKWGKNAIVGGGVLQVISVVLGLFCFLSRMG